MKRLLSLLVALAILAVSQCATPTKPPAPAESGPLGTLEWDFDTNLATLMNPPEEESQELSGGVMASPSAPASGAPVVLDAEAREVIGVDAAGLPQVANVEYEYNESATAAYYLGTTDGSAGGLIGLGGGAGGAPIKEDQTWRKATSDANAMTLRVGDEDELPLRGVEATVWVDGVRARVVIDALFENDRESQLEGTFKLRLPEGATPYYLAFGEEVLADGTAWEPGQRDDSLELGSEPESIMRDREGHWKGARSARFVPRGQAARAYTNTVRRKADPALMEWAGAGVFQTRVFPLMPHKTHRIVVGYELDLTRVPGTGDSLELALDWPEDVPSLSLDLFVAGTASTQVQVTPPTAFVARGNRQIYSYRATQERSFRVRTRGLGNAALVAPEDTGYFAIDVLPELDASSWSGASSAVFLVDTSLSSATSFETWLDLLDATLANNRDSLAEFAVVLFDVTPRWWRAGFTPNSKGAAAELRRFAEGLALEGASDLGAALAEVAQPKFAGADLFLLSDGAATWGEANAHAIGAHLKATGPLFAYTTGKSGTDRRMLEDLTRTSGGAVFTVNGPADIAAASTAHHGRPYLIEGLSLAGCSDLLLRGRPTGIFSGQRLRLVGRGTPQVGDAVEIFVDGTRGREVLRFPITQTLPSPLAARAYGEVATAQLEEFGRTTREAAEAFATRFRVPGKAGSLLMLETEQDYIDQGILPSDKVDLARSMAAGPLVADALEALRDVLDIPARALLEMLEPVTVSSEFLGASTIQQRGERLAELGYETPGGPPPAALNFDPEFVCALAMLPREAFRMQGAALDFAALKKSDVPAGFTAALATGKPAYDDVQDEAARRLAELELGDAVRALSSLVELNPGDGVFARDVAQTLTQWGLFGHAYGLYLRVAEARPFEPQSYLALARCAEEAGKPDLAVTWYTVALAGDWNPRFGDFKQIAAFDALHFFQSDAARELSGPMGAWAAGQANRVAELIGTGPADLAIAIEWNTDGTDIDLHIIDPNNEHCYYGHADTALGGHLTRDVTQGYGPELFVLPHAAPGTYMTFAHFFANNANRTSVRTKILATVWQHFGQPDETVTRREIRLEAADQDHGIVRITVD